MLHLRSKVTAYCHRIGLLPRLVVHHHCYQLRCAPAFIHLSPSPNSPRLPPTLSCFLPQPLVLASRTRASETKVGLRSAQPRHSSDLVPRSHDLESLRRLASFPLHDAVSAVQLAPPTSTSQDHPPLDLPLPTYAATTPNTCIRLPVPDTGNVITRTSYQRSSTAQATRPRSPFVSTQSATTAETAIHP